LLEFVLNDPFAQPELRLQIEKAMVVSRCGCGCASVNFDVPPTVPPAQWDAGDTPYGRDDWVPLTAHAADSDGDGIEVTLHVVSGYIYELEIWNGYGQHVFPQVESLQLAERLSARTEFALAHALSERLRPHLPDGVVLRATSNGAIEIHRGEQKPATAYGFGGLDGAARSLLDNVECAITDLTGGDWLTCPAAKDDDECACMEGHAALADGRLRLWYGDAEHPTLALPDLPLDELDRLARAWTTED
jgi:hypothetical protein